MNEKKKLEEAKYFYSKMISEQETREAFIFNLSAFLSATRSMLQYALKEASQKQSGQSWYDNLMNSSLELRFFKDKRDLNIHEQPVQTKANYILHAETGRYIITHGSVTMTVYDKDGNIKEQVSSNPNHVDYPTTSPEKVRSNPIPNEVKYYFDDWTGNEDVLILCNKCIQYLENAINDGISRQFITG